MIFISAKEREYVAALLAADSIAGVRAVMDVWYKLARQDAELALTLVVDAYMQAHDWERALQSLIRTYGRDSRRHRFMFQMLETAIRQSQALSEYGLPSGLPLPDLDGLLDGGMHR